MDEREMPATNKLRALLAEVDYLERIGARIISADVDSTYGPRAHLSHSSGIPAHVLRREEGSCQRREYVEHYYVTDRGVRVFWLTEDGGEDGQA